MSRIFSTAKKAKLKVVELLEEVTFDTFWDLYAYKFDKKRALDKWKKLNKTEQTKAYSYIKSYKNEIARSGASQMYAKTYLQNKVFLTD